MDDDCNIEIKHIFKIFIEGIHSYFKNVEAQNWRINHYLGYRLEKDELILPWITVYDDWQSSLKVLLKSGTKQIPGSVHGFCTELLEIDDTFEGSIILKICKELYEEFHDQYLDLQIAGLRVVGKRVGFTNNVQVIQLEGLWMH